MLTVLTQNIWGGAPFWSDRRRALAHRISDLKPDLVGLQEVHASDPDGKDSQAHELAELIGGFEVVFAPGRIEASGRSEGVALLSRHAVRASESIVLTQDRDDVLDRLRLRVVLWTLFETSEGPVDVLVTHLSISRPARIRTIQEVLAFASRDRGVGARRKSLLMGDLNAGPSESTIGVLSDNGWLDAWPTSNGVGSHGGTWPAIAPIRRIDYILVRPSEGWVVHSCDRLPKGGSDHRGVTARLGDVPTASR